MSLLIVIDHHRDVYIEVVVLLWGVLLGTLFQRSYLLFMLVREGELGLRVDRVLFGSFLQTLHVSECLVHIQRPSERYGDLSASFINQASDAFGIEVLVREFSPAGRHFSNQRLTLYLEVLTSLFLVFLRGLLLDHLADVEFRARWRELFPLILGVFGQRLGNPLHHEAALLVLDQGMRLGVLKFDLPFPSPWLIFRRSLVQRVLQEVTLSRLDRAILLGLGRLVSLLYLGKKFALLLKEFFDALFSLGNYFFFGKFSSVLPLFLRPNHIAFFVQGGLRHRPF